MDARIMEARLKQKQRKTRPPADRFWEKVRFSPDPDGCWEWVGAKFPGGYGNFYGGNCQVRAHRYSWARAYGPLKAGMCAAHAVCDNPACVRPSHLKEWTQKQNVADMRRKGRQGNGLLPPQRGGELNRNARLTKDQVRVIRARYAAGGVTQVELASEYGVGGSNIGYIIRGKRWSES